ncbi:phosphoribosyltransferase family protein [Acidiluteibacter ferrifornacis]|uniref:Phosphoribosyltransferase n=1 Tax=Acidiluteibacter ferrifornacis TaxID=2692424 RepID=A0A6N9NL66_9FLAO|nr:phosphoribosyltransferase family protein [Acidiluteibacter ferrifornacis]MBR9831629.1 phosphoribosyltransferase [bacterium]NBG65980.1 phosphoribosyltransferase [Acidiluteibacter ferrifornacis]
MAANKTLILDHDRIIQKVNRIAYQIFEDNYTEKEIIIAGIAPKGFQFAELLSETLKSISKIKIQLVELKIKKDNPIDSKIELSLNEKDLSEKVIIVVDDVLNSGRTLIYGVNYFLNGPIKKLSTAVLVNRNHRRFPISADYVGVSLSTTLQDHVEVFFSPSGTHTVHLK